MAKNEIFVVTTDYASHPYVQLTTTLSTEGAIKDILYAHKKFTPPKMSKKLEFGMKKFPVILVFCSTDLKNYMDDKNGDSKCDLLRKEEKSVLEKGFKENEKKIILVQYTEGDESKMKPNCLKNHSLLPTHTEEEIAILKSRIRQKLTINQPQKR